MIHLYCRSHLSFTVTGRTANIKIWKNRLAIEASGASIVTVAIPAHQYWPEPGEPNLLDVISPDKYTILPNTQVVIRRRCGKNLSFGPGITRRYKTG